METSGVVEGHGVEAGKVECEPSLIEADLELKGDSTGLSGDGSGKQEEDNDDGDNLVGGEECKSELSDFPSDHVSDTRLDALESQGFVNADNGHDDSESLLCENKGSETEFVGSGETEAEVRVPVDTNCNLELQDLENDEHELELQSLVNGGNEPETGLEKYGDREIETTCMQNGESGIETTCAETETLLANGDNELQIECSVHGNCQGELPCVVIEQPGTETHLSVEGNGELETRVLVNGNRENESQCIVSEDNQLELQCGVNGDGELEPQHTIHAEPESDLNEVKKLESQYSVNGDDGIARVARGEEVGDVPLGNDEISDLESGSCNGSNIDAVSDLPDEKSEGCNETQQSDAKDANWVSVVDPEPSHELPSSAGDWVSTVNGEPSNKQLCPAADWVSTVDREPSNEQFCPAADWVPVVDPEPSNGMLSPPALANEQKSEADAPKKTVYCLVKIPRHVDNKIRAQIRLAQLQLNEKTERRDFIRAALQMKRASREEMLDRLRTARYEERVTRDAIRCKRQEMEPVQLTLNKMKNATSVEEFEEKIYQMEYRIEHETMPLREEKQLVREINQLKLTRDQLCASAGPHLELQEAFDQIDKIQEHSKMLGQEMDSLRKQAFEAEKNTQSIEKDFVALNDALKQLQGQWNAADIVRQEAYEVLRALKKQEYEKNNEFYKNKGDIQAAKHHALARNMEALDELCSNRVERIMEMWNKNVEFRKEYMKDNERSTLKRLETLDGRSLGPDEEPPLPTSYSDDLDPSSVPQAKPSSSNAKPEREDRLTTAVQQSNEEESKTNGQLVPPKEAEAPKKSSAAKSRKPQPQILEAIPKIEAFEMSPVSVEKEEEDLAKKEEEAAKLKERRRLEEMTKAKEAEERKRRLAEKAKAKANARAQKESERKEKERQKRANKRAAAAAAANRTGDDTTSSSDRVQVDSSQNSKSPVVEMKETKAVSQKPATLQHKKLVSQKSKPRSVFLPAKKSRKGPQIWMWILLAVVLCLSFLTFQQLYL